VPAEPGLFRLAPQLDREVIRTLPATCHGEVRFMLSVEISTIYKRADRTRKVHHLVYVPDFDAAAEVSRRLGRIGNLGSDGRPILGLDSRDLLEISLAAGGYLVPAHVWTPWFAVFGSKSGFDALEECYLDLTKHVFALETGLSSDPAMNWRVSALDRYRLVSNSDAHSPPALGREATVFDTELDYFAIRRALETGAGFGGTVEFFPEEGKYHADGHRACGIHLAPAQTRALGGRCPACGKPVTVGVLHRVEELADRPAGVRPEGAPGFANFLQLPQIIGELRGVGPRSKKVVSEIARLTALLGPELEILQTVPLDEVAARSRMLATALERLRSGRVISEPGYDGEYGVIRVFEDGEAADDGLFELTEVATTQAKAAVLRRTKRLAVTPTMLPADSATTDAGFLLLEPDRRAPVEGAAPRLAIPDPAEQAVVQATGTDHAVFDSDQPAAVDGGGVPGFSGLDPDQRAAVAYGSGPLLIVAGPGTGKTRTLTHRIAHLVTARGVRPEVCLAITFTRRAADEMRERLRGLLPDRVEAITVTTFHSLGFRILREQHERAGLPPDFQVEDDGEIGFDDLIRLPVELLESDQELAATYRGRYQWISVDEYQDVDEWQYRMLRQLAPPDGNLCAIGDPDQAIYGFRGADVGFFLRFQADYPKARVVRLTRNYRSGPDILAGALQTIAPATLVRDRELHPADPAGAAAPIGLYHAADTGAEASFVARTIDQLLGGTSLHSLDTGRASAEGSAGLSFADIAVLYRADAQSQPIMEALTSAGVPFQKRSHDRLLDRPGVRAILKELAHHRDLASAADAVVRREPGRAAEVYTASQLLRPLAERCGSDLDLLRTQLAMDAEVDTWDPRADLVSLLTLHASKGLEFKVVFIVGCAAGVLPSPWADDVREERRLCFVGMTRARRHLYLSHGGPPSVFLADLCPEVTERLNEAVPRQRSKDRQLRLL
jgi:ATP-dependent DNA helicase UvrD/PcrA